jgi:drug/metabolite transporter (DMT)-like permease
MWFTYAVAASALWGLEYALMGRLFDGRISPLFLLSIQMLFGALILCTVCVVSGTFAAEAGVAVKSPEIMRLVFFSILVFTLGSYMIATSIQGGNALVAGLVEISYPLFILVFTLALGWAEPIGARALIGGLLIVAGAAIIQSAR